MKARAVAVCLILGVVFTACSGRSKGYGYYRLDDNFSNAVSIEAPMDKTESGGQAVSLDGDWTSRHATGTVTKTDSGLQCVVAADDFLQSPTGLEIHGDKIDAINLKMRVSGAAKINLRWIPQGGDLQDLWVLGVRVTQPDQWVSYKLEMTKVRAWRQCLIDQMLFEVPQGASLEIQGIELVNRRAAFANAPAGTVHYSIGNRLRPCIYNHCPGTLNYQLRLPANPVFRAGLGIVDPDNPVTFQVFVKSRDKMELAFTREINDPSLWTDVEVDLAEYAGKNVELSLVTHTGAAGQIALWSNPAVFEQYKESTQHAKPNVILYVIDCLRADHLDAYGYDRVVAPNLAAFAANSTRFERCFSVDTWTKSSTTSFATGVDHMHHGVEKFGDVLPEGLVTFPELLRRTGYETCVLTENPYAPPETLPRAAYSFLEPIHLRMECGEPLLTWQQLPEATSQASSAFMRKYQGQPFFMYVHSMELHDRRLGGPDSTDFAYDPPEPYDKLFVSPSGQTSMDLYDGAIAFADVNFKTFLERLDLLGLRENTIIIVTADHGEAFGEHEGLQTHNNKPYNTVTHVPLIVQWPGHGSPGVVRDNVTLLDLAPTILETTGTPPCEQFEGTSLVPLLQGHDIPSLSDRLVISKWYGECAVVKGDWKLLCDVKGHNIALYDLKNDFDEKVDLSAEHPELVQSLTTGLQGHIERQSVLQQALSKPESGTSQVKVDSQTEEQLKALGYLQ